MKGIQALVTGAGFLLLLLALPFIWLYDKVGGPLFIVIVFGIPGAIWWFSNHRKKTALDLDTHKLEATRLNAKVAAKRIDESNRQALLEKHRAKEKKRETPPSSQARVHHVEGPYGELTIDWRRQFEEIDKAWRQGDYDFARDWLQKLAYRLKSEEAPEAVHTKFKALMVEFTRDDPLYAEVMRQAIPAISDNPGIIQSQLAKQFPQFDSEQFRYAMYYGEVIGDVIREKKGRSYALQIPRSTGKNAQNQIRQDESMKDTTKQLLMAYIAATLNKMPDEWGAPRVLSGMNVVEVLWPLNDLFRPHLKDVGELPYESRNEADADAAIEGFVARGEVAWCNLPAGVWRVLMERHQQALVVSCANDAAGNSAFMTIPAALPEAALRGAAMIYLLHGMTLPFPVKPRLASEFPPVDAPATYLLH